MQSFPIGCRTLRDGVVVGAVFLFAGLALLGAGKLLVPSLLYMDALVQGLGALLLLFVPFILITTYLRTAAGGEDRPAGPPGA